MQGAAGIHKRVNTPFASAASFGSAVNIQGANKVAVEIDTIGTLLGSANVSIRMDVCDTSTGTFRPLYAETVASAASGVTLWETLQGGGNIIAECKPAVGFNFARVHLSTAATDGMDNIYIHLIT